MGEILQLRSHRVGLMYGLSISIFTFDLGHSKGQVKVAHISIVNKSLIVRDWANTAIIY